MRGIVLFPVSIVLVLWLDHVHRNDPAASNDSHEFIYSHARGIRNRHLQNYAAALNPPQSEVRAHWQRLELSDGDFVDLAWSEEPQQAKHKPRLVVFHGGRQPEQPHGLVRRRKSAAG